MLRRSAISTSRWAPFERSQLGRVDGAVVHQSSKIAAQTVVPGAAVEIELGWIGDGVVAAQVGGHGVENGEVEAG